MDWILWGKGSGVCLWARRIHLFCAWSGTPKHKNYAQALYLRLQQSGLQVFYREKLLGASDELPGTLEEPNRVRREVETESVSPTVPSSR